MRLHIPQRAYEKQAKQAREKAKGLREVAGKSPNEQILSALADIAEQNAHIMEYQAEMLRRLKGD